MNVLNLYIELTNLFIHEISKEIGIEKIEKVQTDMIEESPLLFDEQVFDPKGMIKVRRLRKRLGKVKEGGRYLLKNLRYFNKRLIEVYGDEIMAIRAFEKYNDCYERIKKKYDDEAALVELIHFLPEDTAIDDRIDMFLGEEMKEKFRRRTRQFMDSKDRYELLFNSIGQPVFVLDLDMNIVEMNSESKEIFGKDDYDVLGTAIFDTHMFDKENRERFKENIHKIIEMKQDIVRDTYHVRSGGEPKKRVMDITSTGLVREGDVLLIINICRDITQRVLLETDLKDSLEEKKVLLKEIHHRVKNNMQIIMSILDRQSRYFKDGRIDEVVLETRNRIMSMSMLHNKLYRSENLAKIRFPEYCEDLAKHIVNTYRMEGTDVRLRTDIDNVLFDLDILIPLGIIITELVSNSMKHAFEDSEKGEISISMDSMEGAYELTVADTGAGIPPDHDKKLGLSLVNDLVDQIDGDLEINNEGGAVFKIRFRTSDNHEG